MSSHNTLFTPTEAAFLTGLPLKAVNNAIDKKTIGTVPGEDAGRPTRLLDARALVSLTLEKRLTDRLAPELRRKMFDALAASPAVSCRSKADYSRSICASRGANWRHHCVNCAGRAALSSAIQRSWAATRCFAALACLCI